MLPNLFHPFTGDPVEAGAPLSQAGERCPPFSSRAHTHTKRPMAYLVTYQNYNNTSEHSGALWSSMEPPLRSSLELCGALPSSLFLLKPLQVWCSEIHILHFLISEVREEMKAPQFVFDFIKLWQARA